MAWSVVNILNMKRELGSIFWKSNKGNLMWFVALTSAKVLFEKTNFQTFSLRIFFFSVCKIFHQASSQLCAVITHQNKSYLNICGYSDFTKKKKNAWQPLTAFIYLFLFWEEFKRDEIICFPPLKHFTALWIWRNKDTTFRNWVTWEIFFFFHVTSHMRPKKVTLTELIEN